MIVITAVTSHAVISSAGEPSVRDMSAETMKMPDPIIDPMTIAVAEKRPKPCTKWGAAASRPPPPPLGSEGRTPPRIES